MLDKTKKYLIVGLGLIGGSYARALSRQGFHICAIDIDADAISYALAEGIIEAGAAFDDSALIRDADIIILGLYPLAMVDWVKAHQHLLKAGVLLTDVSGVKRAVTDVVQSSLRADVEFIPSHPMAGREVGGVRNSDDKLFYGANFIVTPTEKNSPQAIEWAKALGEALGFARISVLSPEEHDRMIGYLSQLTHAIAVSLMTANANPNLADYTGDSFRDLTRIARINETLWYELFWLNRDMLVPEIDTFIGALNDLKDKLSAGDEAGVKALFCQSTKRRKLFDKPKPE